MRTEEAGGKEGGARRVLLPRQLTHHLQQSLVLLFQLLVLVLDVIQVLPREQKHGGGGVGVGVWVWVGGEGGATSDMNIQE